MIINYNNIPYLVIEEIIPGIYYKCLKEESIEYFISPWNIIENPLYFTISDFCNLLETDFHKSCLPGKRTLGNLIQYIKYYSGLRKEFRDIIKISAYYDYYSYGIQINFVYNNKLAFKIGIKE